MHKNVGTIDKAVRIIGGIALLVWAYMGGASLFDSQNLSWIGWIGVVPILTAVMSWCPLYTILGIQTCPADSKG